MPALAWRACLLGGGVVVGWLVGTLKLNLKLKLTLKLKLKLKRKLKLEPELKLKVPLGSWVPLLGLGSPLCLGGKGGWRGVAGLPGH